MLFDDGETIMSSVSSEIRCSGNYTLRVEGIDVNTFDVLIAEFRQNRKISSFDMYLASDGVDGGVIFAKTKKYLEEFRDFLRKNKGFKFRDDLDG
jgi:hypothetical protein